MSEHSTVLVSSPSSRIARVIAGFDVMPCHRTPLALLYLRLPVFVSLSSLSNSLSVSSFVLRALLFVVDAFNLADVRVLAALLRF